MTDSKLIDFYYSAKSKDLRDSHNTIIERCLFKGQEFTEQIAHGKEPITKFSDVVFLGTGTKEDIVYVPKKNPSLR